MRYSKIHIKIWNDKDFLALEPIVQRLFLYLLTSPHSNLLGVYVLKVGYVCEDLGYSNQDEFLKHMAVLSDKDFIKWYESDTILILPNYIKHNPITNENQVTGGIKVIKSLHLSSIISGELSHIIQGLTDLKPSHKQVLCKALGKVLPEGLMNKEEETEEEEETEIELRFAEFWRRYLRKEGKTKALALFKKHITTKSKFTDLLKALTNYNKQIELENTQPKFIKHGSTFMNNWQDYLDVEPVVSTARKCYHSKCTETRPINIQDRVCQVCRERE